MFNRFSFTSRTLFALAVMLLSVTAYALPLTKSPTALQANDVSTLSAQLTAAATSLTLNPVKKWVNGVKTTGCFNTGSGFLLIQDSLGRTEWASFGDNSCSATYYTTLSNLRRGLSPTYSSFTAGTGLAFDAGATVKVVDYPLVYNYTLKKDVPNFSSGSGAWICNSTTQPCVILNAVTTAQRNAFTYGTAAGMYPDIFNSTLGVKQYWNGSAWISFGSGSTIDATETAKGTVELGTVKDQSGATVTGDSGAATVVQTRYLIRNSAGAADAGKIAILDRLGLMTGSLLGTGTPSSTTFLRGDQSWATPRIYSGSNLAVNQRVTSNFTLTNQTTFTQLNGGLTVSMTVSAGDLIHLNFLGVAGRNAGSNAGRLVLDFQVGNNPINNNGSGALAIEYNSTETALQKNISYSYYARMATGGTLTFQPIYRMTGDTSLTYGMSPNTTFQVVKVH